MCTQTVHIHHRCSHRLLMQLDSCAYKCGKYTKIELVTNKFTCIERYCPFYRSTGDA